jgi:cell division protein FtsW
LEKKKVDTVRAFFDTIFSGTFFEELFSDPLGALLPFYIQVSRIVLPFLAILIVGRCALSLMRGKSEPETWAWLGLGDGVRLPVNHWENIIGRSASADIVLPMPEISRNHAALIREESASWRLIDIARKNNLLVNDEPVEGTCILTDGDVLSVAGNELVLAEITPEEDEKQRAARTVPGKQIRPSRTLAWLSVFIFIIAGELALAQKDEYGLTILLGFFWLLVLMWLSWLFSRALRRTGFEIETLAFFLSALGLAVIASGAPEEIFRQDIAVTLGILGFFILSWILRDMGRIRALRWPAAAAALLALGYVLLFGESIFGARNWITVFGYSLQLSELVKVLFIFAGAASLDRLFAKRNLYAFIALSAVIVGTLALMSDFGTAFIFFAVYLIIAYLRSGDLATVSLSLAGAAIAVLLVLTVKPYVAERFATWGHAWEFAATGGYQQTRAMSVIASGGFFGLGGGEGWLKQVAAADTDLVFAFVCEEWGLIIASLTLVALIVITLFAVRSAFNARSSYYVIAACATGALLLFQTMLNVGGSLDLLPLTGVTFPFVSNGGTSMIASWCLLAFLKAADTRQNASFAIRLPRRRRKREIFADE